MVQGQKGRSSKHATDSPAETRAVKAKAEGKADLMAAMVAMAATVAAVAQVV